MVNLRPIKWLAKVYLLTLALGLLVWICLQLVHLLTNFPSQITSNWDAHLSFFVAFPVALPVAISFISPVGALSLLGLLIVGMVRETKAPGKLFLNHGFGYPEWLLVAGLLGTVGFAVYFLIYGGHYTAVYLAGCAYWFVNLLFVWWMTRRQLNRLAQA